MTVIITEILVKIITIRSRFVSSLFSQLCLLTLTTTVLSGLVAELSWPLGKMFLVYESVTEKVLTRQLSSYWHPNTRHTHRPAVLGLLTTGPGQERPTQQQTGRTCVSYIYHANTVSTLSPDYDQHSQMLTWLRPCDIHQRCDSDDDGIDLMPSISMIVLYGSVAP